MSTATYVLASIVVDGLTTASAMGSIGVVLQLSTTADVRSAARAAISASKSDSEISDPEIMRVAESKMFHYTEMSDILSK